LSPGFPDIHLKEDSVVFSRVKKYDDNKTIREASTQNTATNVFLLPRIGSSFSG
jgi:hypothetical protein